MDDPGKRHDPGVQEESGSVGPELAQALSVLSRVARTAEVARTIQGDTGTALLQSVVETAVALFDVEAASIAVFEADPDRLEFRAAAGPQGAGVVGLSVPVSQGVAGYVFSTGQALALSDVRSDPRFDRPRPSVPATSRGASPPCRSSPPTRA